jgi:hypothetical protein
LVIGHQKGRLKPDFRRPFLVFRILFAHYLPQKHEADGNGRTTGATTKHQAV